MSDDSQIFHFRALRASFTGDVGAATSPPDVEKVRVRFLGKKSELVAAMKGFAALQAEQRANAFKQANELKAYMEAALAQRLSEVSGASKSVAVDVTLPGSAVPQGRLHPVTQTMDAILACFIPMGFEIADGPELEFEYYNFDALNIPRDHPSRESFDTFFVDAPSPQPQKGRLLLRSHTSPVQIRVMERRKPPLRIVVPGKVFRPDPLDAGHSFMFHQVEGLMVDDRTSFADLKGVLEQFLAALFGPGTKTRFRPHFFPFTEPSAEVDLACASCRGGGCSTCGQKGWVEIMGCGMVHPNVFKAVGYDANKVQGFAFGLGVERIAMLKHGIKDIRLFFENDLRFLEQF
ncbi:MAG: phenylalanine--tRNA ligase subunit alpha [Candidatus Omnitrophica bacterium]|nr:phenylalanine--tRNA ligase subunit alpha [Candidatus Omnitrophota bacterium]